MCYNNLAGVVQRVEHQLTELKVVGSRPASRSKPQPRPRAVSPAPVIRGGGTRCARSGPERVVPSWVFARPLRIPEIDGGRPGIHGVRYLRAPAAHPLPSSCPWLMCRDAASVPAATVRAGREVRRLPCRSSCGVTGAFVAVGQHSIPCGASACEAPRLGVMMAGPVSMRPPGREASCYNPRGRE